MKYVIVILSLIVISGEGYSQAVVNNMLAANTTPPAVHSPVVGNSSDQQSYSVTFIPGKKNGSLEIISPKADKAEVKLVSISGNDICLIHKGVIREGKNLFKLRGRPVGRGVYYVISKLASGEQFADKIVIDSK
ncbi:MAG TPA: hypothetical protein VEW28_04795 [Candidatus Kapabacteria bacterium]|nr:hypothetical protein [Candidatus Kapabacteria bacterium]